VGDHYAAAAIRESDARRVDVDIVASHPDDVVADVDCDAATRKVKTIDSHSLSRKEDQPKSNVALFSTEGDLAAGNVRVPHLWEQD
jgi:hypothetical protein